MSGDITEKLGLQSLLKIDEDSYKNYLDQYIRVPNSPHLSLWEIFTEYFIKNRI